MTKEEKEAAKAAKAAEKEAAKEAAKAVELPAEKAVVEVTIDCPGVICDRVPVGSKAYSMLANLASQKRVRTRIPREAKEPQGAFATVILNGLRVNILKGVSVEIPSQIADIIDDSYYQTEKAINDTKVKNPFTGKESNARVDMKSEEDQVSLNA